MRAHGGNPPVSVRAGRHHARQGGHRPPILLRGSGRYLFTFLICAILGLMASPVAAGDPFPCFPCIQANVAFWKKVYAQYPSTTGLIHDNRDLGIIYEVVHLEGDDTSAGCATNERSVEASKERYRRILTTLATGRPPVGPDEKRVAALFGPGAKVGDFRAAVDNIRFQRCLSDRFQAGLVRSGRYIDEIREIFGRYGLPADLAYLPHVESSFDYQAYSKSGAAGIWQLIKATGSRFLTITTTVDERRDPILASHAAAKYLQGNYRKLQSWPLALTAYNHGLTSMLRAKNSLGSYEKIYSGYANKTFGFASRNFYAEFLAAREIAQNYRTYFPGLRLDDPVGSRTFAVNRAAGIRVLTSHFKVGLDTLAELNPALLEPVWSGQRYVPKGYRLRLPKGAGGDAAIAALPPAAARHQAAVPKRTPSHRVQRGETINAIARRYGVSTRALLASNQLTPEAVITTGQKLRIPLPEPPVAKKPKSGGKSGKDKS